MALWMKLLHVLTAFWFIGGLMGRTLAMHQAARMDDIKSVVVLAKLAGYFERWMVIPGSMVVLGSGLLTAWLERLPVLGSLQGVPINWLLVSTVLYFSLIPIIKFILLPRGKIFGQALEAAITQGQITPALTAAFRDRAVAVSHLYEFAATLLIIALMVTKPF